MRFPRGAARTALGAMYRPLMSAKGLVRADVHSLRVLVFHDVPVSQRTDFVKLIRFLHDRYSFISTEHFGDVLSGADPESQRQLLLTFDDGFRSNLWVARELLRPLGIKALFFIPSEFPDCVDREEQRRFVADRIFDGRLSEREMSDDLAPMSWEDLGGLLEDGHSVGSHTVTHARLSALHDPAGLDREIVGSAERLANRLGAPIDHFAYPFGDIDSIASPALHLARTRYKYVHSCIRGPNSPGMLSSAIRREGFAPNDPARYVGAVIEGGLDWYYRGRARRLEAMAGT